MSNIIVMTFSPRNIVGCLLKKRLTKGGGVVTGTPGPPSLRPCFLNYHYLSALQCIKIVRRIYILITPGSQWVNSSV